MNTNLMNTKCAFISVVGRTNVGKSTLVNSLVGAKISIVTHKAQTTRSRIRAILTEGDTQLIFIDTPGVFDARQKLEKCILKNAYNEFSGADMIILVIDPHYRIDASFENIIKRLSGRVILVINKIDLIDKTKLLPMIEELNNLYKFERTFMVSATRKKGGVDDLREYLLTSATEGVWHYDQDDETDMPLRFNLAEITREKLFLRFHQELPYSLAVETENIEEKENKVVIHQIVYVISEGHKKIIIGSKGEAIKKIRLLATEEIEKLLDKRINLFLFIKIRENWVNRADILSTISY